MPELTIPKTKNIIYEDATLKIKNVVGQLMPADIFVLIGYSLEKSDEKNFHKNFYGFGFGEGERIISKISAEKRIDNKQKLEITLNQMGITGNGIFQIALFNPSEQKFMIKVESTYALIYKKIFGFQKKAVDVYLAGMIAGALSFIYEQKFKVEEKYCIVQGKNECLFEASPA